MPVSKQRKKHKTKVNQFHQRVNKERNEIQKMEKSFMNRLLDYNENARKELLIQKLHTARPDFVVEQDDVFVVNEELIETQNDVLVWKETGNPILAGLETMDFMPVYTVPVVNLILRKYHAHVQAKTAEQAAAGEVLVQEATFEELEPITTTPAPAPEVVEGEAVEAEVVEVGDSTSKTNAA